MLYVSNGFKEKILCPSSTTLDEGKPKVLEYLTCSVQHVSSPPVFVAVIHRPANAKLMDCDLVEVIERHSVGFTHRIIMEI